MAAAIAGCTIRRVTCFSRDHVLANSRHEPGGRPCRAGRGAWSNRTRRRGYRRTVSGVTKEDRRLLPRYPELDDRGSSTILTNLAAGLVRIVIRRAALGPGASTDLLLPIPAGCFSPDRSFRINVDAKGDVAEANEGNSTANGTCIG